MLRLETITGNVANEPTSDRQWYQKGSSGKMIAPGNPNFADMSPLAAFVHMMHLKADETVVQWYGKGGAFVDAGLPMYLALERKPDNSGKIQNLANVALGIMLHLKVVKSANEEKAIAAAASADITAAVQSRASRPVLARFIGAGTVQVLQGIRLGNNVVL